MVEQLLQWAKERGYRIAWGSTGVADAASAEVEGRARLGELDERFYNAELKSVVAAGKVPAEGTLVAVAVPRPAHRVHFEVEGGMLAAILPPTYLRYRALFEEVRLDLSRNGLPGTRVEHMMAPLKATVARLGLVRYGRNNLSYVDGLGSYVQLCAYRTDASLPSPGHDTTCAQALLDLCEGCGACAGVCPTGAIGDERVLIEAHRCLTFANELPGEWPEWTPRWGHTCLLGCLECQRVCPANPELEVEETGVAFSASETRSLLASRGAGADRVESGIRAKLAWLGQPDAEAVLGRNLRALTDAPESPR